MKLRKLLKNASKIEIAQVVGVSRQVVYEWESGDKRPSLPHIQKLAQYFKLSIDELLQEDPAA